MRAKWLWMVVTLVLVNEWYHHHCCYGCLEQERIALLHLKASFNDPDGNSSAFQNWVDNKDQYVDCCTWDGVECNTNRKRVIKLNLDSVRGLEESWYLNASLFLPFHELKSLDLKWNNFAGCTENQGFGVLSNLRNLEHLNLKGNYFNDSILSDLSGLSSLKYLNLAYNKLTGSVHMNGFGILSRLRNLEKLDIGGNNLNDTSLSSLSGLSSLKSLDLSWSDLTGLVNTSESYNLTNLEELFLDGAYLPAHFLQSIGALSALKVLSLARCNLNGTLPPKGWCELKNLEELYLIGNDLEGLLPVCLGNLSSLRLLDITGNRLAGNIASGPLTKLTLLEYLSLSSNHFQVPVSFKSFMNHSSLKFLSCDNNKLIADPTFQTFTPKFQLKYFSLSNCTSKALNVKFPNFLYSQHDLVVLDLSYNFFSGMFPSWALKNNTRLEELRLSHNSFMGPLQLPNRPNSKLSTIHISNNNISGQIPRDMCLIFPQLLKLFMANNGLTGSIPPCLGNMSSLQFLDLSNNQLSGGGPELFTSLLFVKLSNNKLDGQISPSVFNSSSLFGLYLDGNNFEGQILDIAGMGLPQCFALDISDNYLSGMLPRWMGNMSDVEEIDLSKNQFEGPILSELCEPSYLDFLDLSENNLSGSIPFCFNRTGISHLHLYKNQLSGPLTNALYNSSNLWTLDLRDNFLIGPIPNWIGTLEILSVLLLKGNHFDGDIPVQLCLLNQISILDLSQNNFSGSLPSCLGNLTFETSYWKASVGSGTDITELESIRMLYFKSTRQVTPPDEYFYSGDESSFSAAGVEVVVEFTTKRNSYAYKGGILNFMSGIDLSCNRFTGEIPSELGNLSMIRALNLSHNNLSGSIPTTFSNLKQIESLDLSYNNLNGKIPSELTELNTLAVFSVAYNNLSGKTPKRKAQFGTFDENSYEGNPLLCGPPLDNNCSESESPSPPMPNDSKGEREDVGFIDMDAFFVTFGVSYIIVLLAIAAVLYINPYWRRAWFYFIEVFIDNCYYFVLDHFHKLFILKRC